MTIIDRRTMLQNLSATALLAGTISRSRAAESPVMRRVRPGDPGWPTPAAWDDLNRALEGRLIRVKPLLASCETGSDNSGCQDELHELKNPYYIGEQPAGTQTSGWVDAWRSAPSVYAVPAHTTADAVAAVNFARKHRLRLVVKGGGHSYLGGSNAADSLLIWMRPMDAVTLHESFVGQGCAAQQPGVPAVSIQTGARWLPVYNAVTTRSGRYVQGGGCTTVGVAGLVLGNGFGSFSKRYGSAGSALLEAEVVTADGAVRIVNACTNPDLFWALKGGGNGSLGVVTRLTLQTRTLAEFCGLAFGSIRANSDDAFRRLIAQFTEFYARTLFNPHWGESVAIGRNNVLGLHMVFHDLSQVQAREIFKPFLDFVAAASSDYAIAEPVQILSIPAQHWWDTEYVSKNAPWVVVHDPRSGAPEANIWYPGNQGEVGWFIHGYESAWLPAGLLEESRLGQLNEMLFATSRHWPVALHFNKGLAGAPPEAIAAARETATNPAVTEAFALAIIGAGGPPAYPGMPGPGPDLVLARRDAAAIAKAIGVIRDVVPDAGSYVSEASFSDPEWQRRCFGENYPRLLAVKRRYDPDGLFTTHHGVGSEDWSPDGFTRLS
ncbi:MAG: FAD-binding oxidoreductase [Acetobacteraceae bacterium]|nr:FAD-binding oxidoreductase [Acetobacteraceae bacterium]MBV8522343.1 FAD-binding oxidoreductase [Acetobacteraceae bacterium]